MEGRVVVNIPLDGFKNFGKHPVGINVKPVKWYLIKFFFIYAFDDNLLSSNNYTTRKQPRTSRDGCLL
jgi:hypothetical protein